MKKVIFFLLFLSIYFSLTGEEKVDEKTKQLWDQWFEEALRKEGEEYIKVRDKIVFEGRKAIIPFLEERKNNARNREEHIIATAILNRLIHIVDSKLIDDCHNRFKWLWENRHCEAFKDKNLYWIFLGLYEDLSKEVDRGDFEMRQYLLMEYTLKKLDPMPREAYEKSSEFYRRLYQEFWYSFFSKIGEYIVEYQDTPIREDDDRLVSPQLEEYYYDILENSKDDIAREYCARSLGRLKGEKAYNILLKLVRDKKLKYTCINEIIERLIHIYENEELQKKLIETLIEIMLTDPSPTIRAAVVEGFEQIALKEKYILMRDEKEGQKVVERIMTALNQLREQELKRDEYFVIKIDRALKELERVKGVEHRFRGY